MAEPTFTPIDEIAELSYEQARSELRSTVSLLQAGNLNLDNALSTWERGEALVTHCESLLNKAEERIAKIRAQSAAISGNQHDAPEGNDPAF